MSRMEHHIGKLIMISSNKDKESFCKERCKGVRPKYMKAYTEFYCDENYPNIIDTSKGLFRVETTEPDECDEICELIKVSDREYKINMRFYNGGTCLSEMVEGAMVEGAMDEVVTK